MQTVISFNCLFRAVSQAGLRYAWVKMKMRNVRKVFAIVMALMLTFVMNVSMFAADDVITPKPVTYPLNVQVVFLAEGESITDVSGTVHKTNYVEEYEDVTFNEPFTNVFLQYLTDKPAAGAFLLEGYPTVMDAICQAYKQTGSLMNGFVIGWDGKPSQGPQGAYVTSLFGNSTITTVSGLYRWEGYSWSIYLNDTNEKWDENTRTGLIPCYASNVQLEEGDIIYVLYEKTEESW